MGRQQAGFFGLPRYGSAGREGEDSSSPDLSPSMPISPEYGSLSFWNEKLESRTGKIEIKKKIRLGERDHRVRVSKIWGKNMDFRRKAEEEDDDEDVSYTPPTIRESAFSKPLLPSSSSLISGRGGAAAGGVRNGIMSDPSSGVGRKSLVLDPATSEGRRGDVSNSNFPGTGSAGEPPAVRYRECLRNHAASLGGHVLDGCGEFMPCSPNTMKCAACCCHRSFHRREAEFEHLHHRQQNGNNHSGDGGRIPLLLPPPAPQKKQIHSFSTSPSAALVALGSSSGGATTTESSSEELGIPPAAVAGGGIHRPFMMPSSKKRFRTKFSSAQKVKMMDFAERIGWRIQRQDDAEMESFCSETGVSRQVFKVWMHNNKHFVRRQPQQSQPHHM
ncbi:ZF-HD homeobox protein [Platanthera guangdongensis]|uniref:ZF-HD homeobox protein n=1 Tax=Platanthera guangdongensis TaxID=2320717 RepID=A0ABR2LH64_9ASPA